MRYVYVVISKFAGNICESFPSEQLFVFAKKKSAKEFMESINTDSNKQPIPWKELKEDFKIERKILS